MGGVLVETCAGWFPALAAAITDRCAARAFGATGWDATVGLLAAQPAD